MQGTAELFAKTTHDLAHDKCLPISLATLSLFSAFWIWFFQGRAPHASPRETPSRPSNQKQLLNKFKILTDTNIFNTYSVIQELAVITN